jgi:hypothetical protein
LVCQEKSKAIKQCRWRNVTLFRAFICKDDRTASTGIHRCGNTTGHGDRHPFCSCDPQGVRTLQKPPSRHDLSGKKALCKVNTSEKLNLSGLRHHPAMDARNRVQRRHHGIAPGSVPGAKPHAAQTLGVDR